jgi:hypothetical protein
MNIKKAAMNTQLSIRKNHLSEGEYCREQFLKKVEQCFLPKGEYVDFDCEKTQLVWHLTAGGPNGHVVKKMWQGDKLGPVGTDFVIEGPGPDSVDGRIIQVVPFGGSIYHLGLRPENFAKFGLHPEMITIRLSGKERQTYALNFKSISVEVCNYGPLRYVNGKFMAYDHVIPKENAIELDEKVYGHRFWQDFSDAQIESMWLISEFCHTEFGIDKKYKGDVIFGMNARALSGEPGHWTHRSFQFPHIRSDIPPLPKIIKLFESL